MLNFYSKFSSSLTFENLWQRAVARSDADTADCVLVSLTEVVPFSWGDDACSRTPQMIDLALNVTACGTMPLALREHASLFVVGKQSQKSLSSTFLFFFVCCAVKSLYANSKSLFTNSLTLFRRQTVSKVNVQYICAVL
jgi:hypothetical protein